MVAHKMLTEKKITTSSGDVHYRISESDQLQHPFEPIAFITSDGTAISYALRNSSFSVMGRYINEVQKLIDNGINTDWEKKNFESYFHLLEDEWKMIRFD